MADFGLTAVLTLFATFMSPVPPPYGFNTFCVAHLPECTKNVPTTAAFTDSLWSEVSDVQVKVDSRFAPAEGATWWDYPRQGQADCNAYALEKMRELVSLGVPRGALLLATAWTEQQQGHTVLLVRTDHGVLVLDNRAPGVVTLADLPYRWVARQSDTMAAEWVAVR